MKFSQIRRITQATVLSLAIGLGMTACSSDYTIDYLYVTAAGAIGSGTNGAISAYKVDNQSGSLTQIVDSPYDSGGTNPVAIALSPNNQALYVVNNQSSTIVEFTIGTDGKIYPQFTYNLGTNPATIGSSPIAAVIDPTNSFLIVAFTYQHGFSVPNPGPGGVMVFPIASGSNPICPVVSGSAGQTTNTLCAPIQVGGFPYTTVSASPVAVGVSPNPGNCPISGGTVSSLCPLNGGNYVPYIYVAEQTIITPTAQFSTAGTLLSYRLNLASGQLTSVATTPAGVAPFAIAEDPTARFVYVTDQTANQLIGYLVQTNGSVNAMINGPFATGLFPQGVVADPRGKFLYVTNLNTSTVNGYAIDPATGTPSGVASNGVTTTGTAPKCVTLEPAQGIYLYTANNQDNSVSGMQIDAHSGALVNIQNTPFNAASHPTCAVAVAAGAHAFESLQP